MYTKDAQLLAEGCLNQAIVSEITAEQKRVEPRSAAKGQAFFSILRSSVWCFERSRIRTNHCRADEVDAGAVGSIGAEAEYDGADCGLDGRAERTKTFAVEPDSEREAWRFGFGAGGQNIETGFGQKIPGIPEHSGPFQVFKRGVSGNAGFRFETVAAVSGGEGIGGAQKSHERIDARASDFAGCVAVHRVVAAEAKVTGSKSRVELAQALYDQAADLQKEGVAQELTRCAPNVELQNGKAGADSGGERSRVVALTSEPPSESGSAQKVEARGFTEFFDTPQPEMDSSIDASAGDSREWKSIDQQVKAALRQKQASQAERLPSLQFDGNWAYQGLSSTSGIPVYTYQLGVNMPLFTGGRISFGDYKSGLAVANAGRTESGICGIRLRWM